MILFYQKLHVFYVQTLLNNKQYYYFLSKIKWVIFLKFVNLWRKPHKATCFSDLHYIQNLYCFHLFFIYINMSIRCQNILQERIDRWVNASFPFLMLINDVYLYKKNIFARYNLSDNNKTRICPSKCLDYI